MLRELRRTAIHSSCKTQRGSPGTDKSPISCNTKDQAGVPRLTQNGTLLSIFHMITFQLKQEDWRVLFQAFSHRIRILFARRDSSKQSFVAACRMNFGKKEKKKNFTMRRYHMIIAFLFFVRQGKLIKCGQCTE